MTRQVCLQTFLERFGCPAVSLSGPFKDGLALLRVAEERGFEGMVSKRRDAPYSSGEYRDWRKVKAQVGAKQTESSGVSSRWLGDRTVGKSDRIDAAVCSTP